MAPTPSPSRVGFFGKLPCNGDFLERRVPTEFLDAWDAWLQDGLVESRRALGDRWLDHYLTSPLWRFALSRAVCGSMAYAGVLAPSVDRVGRYFPLTIVAQMPADLDALDFAVHGAAWFDSLETLVLETLERPQIVLATFDDAIAASAHDLAGCMPARTPGCIDFFAPGAVREGAWRVPLTDVSGLEAAISEVARHALAATLCPLSVWWTQGSKDLSPSWLCSRGLPNSKAFTAMLDGEWAESGWSDAADRPGVFHDD